MTVERLKPRTASQPDGDIGEATRDERRIPLQKAMRILERIAASERADWGVRELARELRMAPSTVHRLLVMLEEASIVESDEMTGRYSVSLEFYRLASQIALKLPFRQTAAKHLRALADRTAEAVYLARYEPKRKAFMFVDYVESRHPLRYQLALHEWLDLRAGAGGLGILAFLAPEEIDAILAQPRTPEMTENTVTDRQVLQAELEEIREQGHVVSTGRLVPGAVGIAAPVIGTHDSAVGAVVLALPEVRLPEYELRKLADDVAETARAISIVSGVRHTDGPAAVHPFWQ